MKLLKLLLIFSWFNLMLLPQVYSQTYYTEIHRAEEYIVDNELEKAVLQYKNTFEEYDYPFSRDLLAATCISQKLADKTVFYQWIEMCLKFGLSSQELTYFINNAPTDTILESFKSNYEAYEEAYLSAIDYEFNKKYLDIDKDDQIRIFLSNSKLNSDSPDKYNIDNDALVKRYIDLVNNYGFPTDKKCGSSASISTIFTDEGLPNYINSDYIVEQITTPDIRDKPNDTVYAILSYKNNRSINSLTKRPGNSLLWHKDIKKYPLFDSLLIQGIKQLKIYPTMYAASLERYDIDYLIGMGGVNSLWRTELKFDLNRIAKLSSQLKDEINNRRADIGIRSIENELALHKAIIKLEGLNEKDFTKVKRRNFNLLYYSLFNQAMP